MNEFDVLRSELGEDGRIRPSYGERGVVNVPDTVAELLGRDADRALSNPTVEAILAPGAADLKHVVLLVIDGFGWNQFQRLKASRPSMRQLSADTTATPLTSTYPSETSAAMISLYTGLQPCEHGLIGWFTRFDDPTLIGHSLPFMTLDQRPLDEAYGIEPTSVFDVSHRKPITERLTETGVDVGYCNPQHIINSHTSELSSGSADLLGYTTVQDCFHTVIDRIEDTDDRSYHLVYWGEADTQGHHHGTESSQYLQAIETAVRALYREFIEELDASLAKETAIMVVADHGQVNTDPVTNVDLQSAGEVTLSPHLERGHDGDPLYLAGGPRNVQLHLQLASVSPVRQQLEAALPVEIYDEAESKGDNLFGDREPTDRFHRRVPDLLAIPDTGSVWYDDGELDHVGMHGGMHPDEMVVPFIGARAIEMQ